MNEVKSKSGSLFGYSLTPVGMVLCSTGFLFFNENLTVKYSLMVTGIVIVLIGAFVILKSVKGK